MQMANQPVRLALTIDLCKYSTLLFSFLWQAHFYATQKYKTKYIIKQYKTLPDSTKDANKWN
jgi:hypothetical protein